MQADEKRDSAIGPTHCPSNFWQLGWQGAWIEWIRGRVCEERRGECDLSVFGGGMLGHGFYGWMDGWMALDMMAIV